MRNDEARIVRRTGNECRKNAKTEESKPFVIRHSSFVILIMSSVEIDPTAIVDSKAELGAGTIVGPYCIIASGVLLGEKCWLQHHVTLAGPMRGGCENRFYAYCSIGQQTQD